jgi:hypothetical protein
MTLHQRVFAVACGLVLLGLIVELVRRRRLKEEFSFLWLVTGVGVVVLAVWHELVVWIARAIGAALPMSALFFFGLLFVIGINLHHAVRLSRFSDHLKDLTQEVVLLQDRLARVERTGGGENAREA